MAIIQHEGKRINSQDYLLAMDRQECEDDLYTFLRRGWKYLDASPFTPGWPIEAVAKHLMAVTDGHIRRLIINIPPRCAKSSLVSCAFPAWTWTQQTPTPTSGPGVQFLTASYAQQLSLRDSVKCRRLIESQWFQKRWGERFHLVGDQNTKTRFDNDKRGSRLATSVGSALTGEGGSIIIVDDPNAAQEAFSEAKIHETIEWWDSALSTRLNDPKTGCFVIIQQRLAENDLTGHILEKDVGNWTHLMLPMKYEPHRSFHTVLVPADKSDDGEAVLWQDPRTEEDELLWPERFGELEVQTLEKQLGPWAAAGQLQQRPEVKGGGVIKVEWWEPWEAAAYPPMDFIVAALDTAYTTKQENDFSAMTVWGVFSQETAAPAPKQITRDGVVVDVLMEDGDGSFVTQQLEVNRFFGERHAKVMMMYAWQAKLELHELVTKVAETMKKLKVDKVLVENKAAGYSVAQELRRLYNHEKWAVQLDDPKGTDKLARLYSIQHLFADGLIYAPDKAWSRMVIDQVAAFPKAKHDDLVDTVSMAIRHLRQIGLLQRVDESKAYDDVPQLYNDKIEPLYPA